MLPRTGNKHENTIKARYCLIKGLISKAMEPNINLANVCNLGDDADRVWLFSQPVAVGSGADTRSRAALAGRLCGLGDAASSDTAPARGVVDTTLDPRHGQHVSAVYVSICPDTATPCDVTTKKLDCSVDLDK